jgi:hypothetical protein
VQLQLADISSPELSTLIVPSLVICPLNVALPWLPMLMFAPVEFVQTVLVPPRVNALSLQVTSELLVKVLEAMPDDITVPSLTKLPDSTPPKKLP